jgi:DNA modification methylase
MGIMAELKRNHVYLGDALAVAKDLPDESVHCIVTSPPYFGGLRSYLPDDDPLKPLEIGQEETVESYIERMVTLFRELRRVLRKDGVCWINISDCYNGSGKGGKFTEASAKQATNRGANVDKPLRLKSFKPKDLVPVSWMLAIALQQDGWWLRAPIIWEKPNPMPASMGDRVTINHEYVFMLTKSARYFYDAEAIKEPVAESTPAREQRGVSENHKNVDGAPGQTAHSMNKPRLNAKLSGGNFSKKYAEAQPDHGGESDRKPYTTRNKHSVWRVATKAFSDAHFATFPEDLIEPMIEAGCPKKTCAVCGAPYVRVTERETMVIKRSDRRKQMGEQGRTQASGTMVAPARSATLGFVPSCDCGTDETLPGVVYDPFMGAFTTAKVARRLLRDYAGSELNPEYIEIGKRRLRGAAAKERVSKNGNKPVTISMFGDEE